MIARVHTDTPKGQETHSHNMPFLSYIHIHTWSPHLHTHTHTVAHTYSHTERGWGEGGGARGGRKGGGIGDHSFELMDVVSGDIFSLPFPEVVEL